MLPEKIKKPVEEYVLDSYPLIVLFKRQTGWEEVRGLLDDATRNKQNLLMSIINWGEVLYSAIGYSPDHEPEATELVLQDFPIDIITPDRDTTRQAAILKAMGGISYADCFAAALAMKEKATLVTGDKEFKRLEKKGFIKVKWI